MSHGYATMNTVFKEYRAADLVKIEVFINYARINALAFIVIEKIPIPLLRV